MDTPVFKSKTKQNKTKYTKSLQTYRVSHFRWKGKVSTRKGYPHWVVLAKSLPRSRCAHDAVQPKDWSCHLGSPALAHGKHRLAPLKNTVLNIKQGGGDNTQKIRSIKVSQFSVSIKSHHGSLNKYPGTGKKGHKGNFPFKTSDFSPSHSIPDSTSYPENRR